MNGIKDLEIKQNNYIYNFILFLVISGVVLFVSTPFIK